MRSVIAVSLLLLPTQGFAAPPAETTGSAQPNKKICKVDPEDTGSKIRRRICKTEAEWNGTKGKKAEAPAEAGNSQGGK
jgi:hypothetical protein